MGLEGREKGTAVERSCLETSSHPTSLLSFPFFLSPPPPSNPTLQIHKLQILQHASSSSSMVLCRGEKRDSHVQKNLLVVLDLLNALQWERRRRIWSIFLGTGLAGVTAYTLRLWSEGSTGTSSICEGDLGSSSLFVLAVQGCQAFVLWTFAL